MPEIVAPHLGMSYGWNDGESGWKPGVDNNFKRLDSLVMPSAKDKDLNTPPVSPANGDRYIVGPSPTGAWATQAGKLATYEVSVWVFRTPKAGWIAWVQDEDLIYRHNGTSWAKYERGPVGGVTKKIIIPAASFWSNAKVERGALNTGIVGIEFADGSDEAAYAILHLPTDLGTSWNAARVLYANEGVSGNNVVWQLGIEKLAADGFTILNSFSPAFVQLASPPPTTTDQMREGTFTSPPTIGGAYAAGDFVKVQIARLPTNGADTNAGTMFLIAVVLEYTNV